MGNFKSIMYSSLDVENFQAISNFVIEITGQSYAP